MRISAIKIKDRHRRDMGDIDALAASIASVGLLHPIVVDSADFLIAGERRLEAVKKLGWKEVEVTVATSLDGIAGALQAERDENTCRKDFSPSEAAAMAETLEPFEKNAAKDRQGQRTDKHLPTMDTSSRGRAADKVAEAVGMGRTSLDKARTVATAAKDHPEHYADIQEEMDKTGKVAPAYKKTAWTWPRTRTARATGNWARRCGVGWRSWRRSGRSGIGVGRNFWFSGRRNMATAEKTIDRTKKKITKRELGLLRFASGGHRDRSNGLCVMEAVAWIAGEPHSDHPSCVSPVIAAFMRQWNDNLPDDETRSRLLRPLAPMILNTSTGPDHELRRGWMAMDWIARTFLPAWLHLAKIDEVALMLEALPEITSVVGLESAMKVILLAKTKADAARDAARDAAGDAAGDAAWAAAWAAARDAVGDAAWAAAWAAARDAAGDAARDAAGDALKPTVEKLQASAAELVERMASLSK